MEILILKMSHNIISRLLIKPSFQIDEAIFLTFRPYYLFQQKNVYSNLQKYSCAICMEEYFKEHLVIQHNRNHPEICSNCYGKVISCPFCRIPLITNIIRLIQ